MKEITIKVMQFDELDENAQKTAIEKTRQEYFEDMAGADWDDLESSLKKFREISKVNTYIQDSSQGHYLKNARMEGNIYDENKKEWMYEGCNCEGEDIWKNMKESFDKEWKEEIWTDGWIKEAVENHTYDKDRSYENNVGWMEVSLCDKMYSETIQYLSDTEGQKTWLKDNEREFLKTGTPYKEII